jgi:urea transport system permease protein
MPDLAPPFISSRAPVERPELHARTAPAATGMESVKQDRQSALAESAMLQSYAAIRVKRLRIAIVASVACLFFVIVPLLNAAGIVQDYRINILGKYLCFAVAALGLDLVWGYTGLLSLCQALFFCLGGYVMAMHLSLPQGGGDVRPEYNNIPQFMFFNNIHDLPRFWRPFASLSFTLAAGVILPAALATALGFFILRSRVRGVYFSIITQALAYGPWLLISRNEMLMGGTNGLTNFSKVFTEQRKWIVGLYLLTLLALVAALLLCRALVRSRLGRILVAIRDRESRLYFAGYKPYAFKVFAFSVGAVLAAVGGMLYAPQVGIVTPQDMDVQASIFMVAWVAVGGRGRLWGAILGAMLVNYARSALTTDLPSVWLFVFGAMFLAVVLFFPDGLIGLWDTIEQQFATRKGASRAAISAIPLAALCAFVLTQALGLLPQAVQHPIGGMPAKYWVLFVLLALPPLLNHWMRRTNIASDAPAALLPDEVAA